MFSFCIVIWSYGSVPLCLLVFVLDMIKIKCLLDICASLCQNAKLAYLKAETFHQCYEYCYTRSTLMFITFHVKRTHSIAKLLISFTAKLEKHSLRGFQITVIKDSCYGHGGKDRQFTVSRTLQQIDLFIDLYTLDGHSISSNLYFYSVPSLSLSLFYLSISLPAYTHTNIDVGTIDILDIFIRLDWLSSLRALTHEYYESHFEIRKRVKIKQLNKWIKMYFL